MSFYRKIANYNFSMMQLFVINVEITMLLLLGFFGIISGITTVLFGFGGGFVTVPLLYSYLSLTMHNQGLISEFAMQISVATSAFIMIFSASLSSYQHHKKGNLNFDHIWSLFIAISIGGCFGALIAVLVDGDWIRWLFMLYLVITIIDCTVRKGFMNPKTEVVQKVSYQRDGVIGIVIGIVAAFLGVGGSIMTVPLMRRRGASMQESAAMANPLTLPMAITSSVVYWLYAKYDQLDFGESFIGFLYIKGAILLIISAWVGIKIGIYLMKYLPDHIHAKAYPILLMIVLAVMFCI